MSAKTSQIFKKAFEHKEIVDNISMMVFLQNILHELCYLKFFRDFVYFFFYSIVYIAIKLDFKQITQEINILSSKYSQFSVIHTVN